MTIEWRRSNQKIQQRVDRPVWLVGRQKWARRSKSRSWSLEGCRPRLRCSPCFVLSSYSSFNVSVKLGAIQSREYLSPVAGEAVPSWAGPVTLSLAVNTGPTLGGQTAFWLHSTLKKGAWSSQWVSPGSAAQKSNDQKPTNITHPEHKNKKEGCTWKNPPAWWNWRHFLLSCCWHQVREMLSLNNLVGSAAIVPLLYNT